MFRLLLLWVLVIETVQWQGTMEQTGLMILHQFRLWWRTFAICVLKSSQSKVTLLNIYVYQSHSKDSCLFIDYWICIRVTNNCSFLPGYKRHHFVLRDLQLAAYRDARDYEAMGGGAPSFIVSLKVCLNMNHLPVKGLC